MVIQEKFGDNLIKSYSDKNKKILQKETGVLYNIAIDIPNKYTYEESTKDIDVYDEEDMKIFKRR